VGFEFDYEPPDRSDSRRSAGHGGSPRRRRPLNLLDRLPRWGIALIVIVLVLTLSTIITSRDSGSDRTTVEDIPARSQAADTHPAPTSNPPTTTPPVTTRLATTNASPVEPETPLVTRAGATADWAELALSIVYIEAGECPSFPPDLYSSGSGTVVSSGTHILTNAHVVLDDHGQPCRELVVWFTNSFEAEPFHWVLADLAAADEVLDLAVLKLREPVPPSRSIEVAEQQLEPGEAIRILGYPGVGGLTMTLTRGVYSGRVDRGGVTYIKTDADISEGSSGGAAFDEAGVFIGVPTAGIEEVGHLVPAGAAERFLDQAYEP